MCSKARAGPEQEEQEPGHLERLKKSSQLPINIHEAVARPSGPKAHANVLQTFHRVEKPTSSRQKRNDWGRGPNPAKLVLS